MPRTEAGHDGWSVPQLGCVMAGADFLARRPGTFYAAPMTNEPSRTVLVTGAARRIGKAIVDALAGDGWRIALHYGGSADEAEAGAAELRARGAEVALYGADLRDEAPGPGIDPAHRRRDGRRRLPCQQRLGVRARLSRRCRPGKLGCAHGGQSAGAVRSHASLRGPVPGRKRQYYQHPGPTGVEPDAAFFVLHLEQGRSLDPDPDRRAGAGARHPGQCGWTGPDPAVAAAVGRPVPGAVGAHPPGPAGRPTGNCLGGAFYPCGAVHDRANDCPRLRTASRLGFPGRQCRDEDE